MKISDIEIKASDIEMKTCDTIIKTSDIAIKTSDINHNPTSASTLVTTSTDCGSLPGVSATTC